MTLFEIIVCILLFVLVVCLVSIGAAINDNAKELIGVLNAGLNNIDVSTMEIRDAISELEIVEDDTDWLEDVPAKEVEPSKGAEF